MVVHVYNSRTWKQGQFEATLGNTRRLCLNSTTNNQKPIDYVLDVSMHLMKSAVSDKNTGLFL